MNITINNNQYFKGAADYDSKKLHARVRQQFQENHVDNFFKTHQDATQDKTSALAIVGAIVGTLIPAIIISKKQQPSLKVGSLKNFIKFFDIEYGLKEIIPVGLGGVIGGLAGGLADKKEKNKLKKFEEATFQAMNLMIPTYLVTKSLEHCRNSKSLNKPLVKAATTIAGVLIGVNAAVVLSNMIDKKVFNKYECNPDRKFRPRDLVVHVDDIVEVLVISKSSIGEKLHLNKILPLIYAWNGQEVGDS